MRKFEIGKRYIDGAGCVEVVKRTAKTITFVAIQHAGKFNERKSETKTAKLNNWKTEEVFFCNCYEFHA